MNEHDELTEACSKAIRALGDVCAVVNRMNVPAAPEAKASATKAEEFDACAAFLRYGRHDDRCDAVKGGGFGVCSCGLEAAFDKCDEHATDGFFADIKQAAPEAKPYERDTMSHDDPASDFYGGEKCPRCGKTSSAFMAGSGEPLMCRECYDAKKFTPASAPISTDEGEMSPPGRIFKLGDDTQFIEAVNHADVLAAARRAFEVTDELNRRAPAPEAERAYKAGCPAHVAFWDAVNEYAIACGAKENGAVGSSRRMDAVVSVEGALDSLVSLKPPLARDSLRVGGIRECRKLIALAREAQNQQDGPRG